MRPTQIYLVRHAESEGNARFARGLGRLPSTKLGSDLTECGITQAEELARDLQRVDLDVIYSSPLRRTHHTAEILAKDHGNKILLMPKLREREKGKETDSDATERFMTTINQLVLEHPGQTIAVITHGFVIRAFLDYVGVKKLDDMPHGYVQNAGYLKFEVLGDTYRLMETKRVIL